MREVKFVGIVGVGQMGGGIAQLFAMNSYKVLLLDQDEKRSAGAVASIRKRIDGLVGKGKLASDAARQSVDSLKAVSTMEAFKEADLVIEAVCEDVGIKRELFKRLDSIVGDDAVLASNTSSIPISLLAEATERPNRVIGVHFMNPPYLIEGVEVIPSKTTDADTIKIVENVVKSLGKKVLRISDSPGFVVNRVLIPMINEAMLVLQEGEKSAEEIDQCMKMCCHLPMGPLALADMIGLDTVLGILNVLCDSFGEKYCPAGILRGYVEKGYLGRKTGRGIYEY